ncbi:MAG TPA: hypothetical protein VFI43_01725 [Nitrosospira sp.]|nr:hypothetical protein [Nitrosospira sp.]
MFAVGFPITLITGMTALMLSLPYFIPVLEQLVSKGLETMLEIAQATRSAP